MKQSLCFYEMAKAIQISLFISAHLYTNTQHALMTLAAKRKENLKGNKLSNSKHGFIKNKSLQNNQTYFFDGRMPLCGLIVCFHMISF